jgi:hypothetical protein
MIESSRRRLVDVSSQVVHVERMDERIMECRRIIRDDTSPMSDLAVALAMATGRRMVELFLTGTMTPDPYGSKYTLVFSGQAKTGSRAIASMEGDAPLTYRIPCLATASSIIRALSRLRGLAPAQTSGEVNSRYCRQLNTRARELVHPDICYHDLRTLYALVSFEVFRPHQYGLNGWVAKVLGHSSLSMSVHYTKLQVSGIDRIRSV